MYTNNKHAFYLRGKTLVTPIRWELIRNIAKDKLSLQGQLKLEWIIFYHTFGKENVTASAKHFGITRKTLHKWLQRFDETRLETLEENSRAPQKTRERDITSVQRIRIIRLRKKHLRWGKMKLQRLYKKEHGEYVSSWKIQKVIEEKKLYFDKTEQSRQQKRRKQAQMNPKKRITAFVKEHKVHHLWHVDTVLLTLSSGGYRYLLTAIDDVSKLAYARLYTTHSSKQAADFLKRLHYLTEGEIINLHHDNGSEFEKDFKKACQQLSLPQWYSRVRTPKDNAVLERFNRTIQEEFVEMAYSGIEEINDFNQELTEWLVEYNSVRPHETLDYLTPLEYIDSYLDTKVSPMSSSLTRIIFLFLLCYNMFCSFLEGRFFMSKENTYRQETSEVTILLSFPGDDLTSVDPKDVKIAVEKQSIRSRNSRKALNAFQHKTAGLYYSRLPDLDRTRFCHFTIGCTELIYHITFKRISKQELPDDAVLISYSEYACELDHNDVHILGALISLFESYKQL